jgi:serine/threonine-protein kinase
MYKVVNDVPPPPSSVEGEHRTARFDDVVRRALAKDPAQRFSGAQAFRQALAEALGQPLAGALSPEVVLAAPESFAPTERIPTGVSTNLPTGTNLTGEPPTHFEAADLAAVEALLARHMGPMAKVLVRRTARSCHDIAELYTRLAEHITNVSAREAFLGQASRSGSATGGTHGTGGSSGMTGITGGSGSSGGSGRASTGSLTGRVGTAAFMPATGMVSPPVSDAWLEMATKLMLAHVGPIAKVMVRRAAERTRVREVLVQEFSAAVPEAQRAKLVAELARLS